MTDPNTPAKRREWRYTEKLSQLRGKWDVVVLQGFITPRPARPRRSTDHIKGAHDLARLFEQANPDVRIDLISTWSRADQVYKPQGHWHGRSIYAMAENVAGASATTVQS